MTLSPAPRGTESLLDSETARSVEAELVRAAVAGSAAALDLFVHTYHRRVFSFLCHMTRQRQDAEDLTQQTFIKACNHLDRFDCEKPIINWLLTIARRTALNHFRSVKKWDFVPTELTSSEPSPAHQIEDRERTDNLWADARRVLSQREFEVLWLRFGEDLSTKETADVVGLTQIHVKVIVHRARQRLLNLVSRS